MRYNGANLIFGAQAENLLHIHLSMGCNNTHALPSSGYYASVAIIFKANTEICFVKWIFQIWQFIFLSNITLIYI